MSESDLKHPDKVVEIIRLAVADQKSEDISYCSKESKTDLVFRRVDYLLRAYFVGQSVRRLLKYGKLSTMPLIQRIGT